MDESQKTVIAVNKLTKLYGNTIGVKDLDLIVRKGEVFGFLGPNGSGKTTTINVLLDLVKPTSGEVRVFGMNPGKMGLHVRARIGFLPSNPGFYQNMKGIEYLRFFAGIRKCDCDKRIRELAGDFFNVDLNRRIGTYSEGMKQIIGIIQAFASSPDLYILDEPTNNLDPLMKRRFYHLVEEEMRRGKTFFLSSHVLEEVERLCDRVGIIREGRLVTLSSIQAIREKMRKTIEVTFSGTVTLDDIRSIEGISKVTEENHRFFLEVGGDLRPILARLATMPLETFDIHKMTLEEIFLEYFEKPDSGTKNRSSGLL